MLGCVSTVAQALQTRLKLATGTVNDGTNPVDWTQLKNVPAGIAAGGYAAGYYGYLWSLVVALDLRTAFAADRLDPMVGMRYRRSVLAQGSQKPPQELLRDFLGRETNSKAFFDDLKK